MSDKKSLVMDRKGISKKNLINFAFVFIIVGFIISLLGFAIAGPYSFWGSGNSTTLDYYRVTGIVVNEDAVNNFSILINSTNLRGGLAYNITRINITLPTELIYINDTMAIGGNLSLNGTNLFISINMNVTTSRKQLSWFNGSADTTVIPLGTNVTTGDIGFNNSRIYFNFTGYEPGVYNMTVRVFYNGSDPLLSSNLTYIQITVNDTTLPKIWDENISIYANNVNYTNSSGAWNNHKNFSGVIMVNVTATDNGGIKDVRINITNSTGGRGNLTDQFYATNASTSPLWWNTSIDTRRFPDGNYTIWVIVNDTSNNLNWSKMANITIDNTPPTGTLTCTPTSVNFYDTVTCTCTSTDALGINAAGNAYTASPSTSEGGVHTEYCYFTDNAGNPGSTSDTYEVEWATDGHTTSGGGEGTPSKSIATISAETPIVMGGFAEGSGVKEIEVTTTSSVSNAQITVTKYDSTPSTISTSKSSAYKYIKVDTQNLADKLSKATMNIYVEKSWVSEQGITKEDVALFKYDESANTWNELTTTYSTEDDTKYYYTVEVTSFSYFAIAPKSAVISEEVPGEGEEQPSTAVPIGVWIVIGVIILAAIIGGGVVLSKKKRR